MRNAENGWSIQEAGMFQLDEIVGSVMKKLKDMGVDDNTIVVFTTDNGAENFTWPDGGQTPFAGGKGTVLEGGFRVPAIARLPGKIRPDTVQNGIFSGLDWFPTFIAMAGNDKISDQAESRRSDRRHEVQSASRRLQSDGCCSWARARRRGTRCSISPRARSARSGSMTTSTASSTSRSGWLGGTIKPDWPILVNLRLDPFERTGLPSGAQGSLAFYNWYAYEFWRFVYATNEIGAYAQTFLEYPPMQKGASFNSPRSRRNSKRRWRRWRGRRVGILISSDGPAQIIARGRFHLITFMDAYDHTAR